MIARDTQMRRAIVPLTLELRQVHSAHKLAQFGVPQDLTRLKPIVEAGGNQLRAQIAEPRPSRELPNPPQTVQKCGIFLSRGMV